MHHYTLTYYDETKKRAHNSHIVGAKKLNLVRNFRINTRTIFEDAQMTAYFSLLLESALKKKTSDVLFTWNVLNQEYSAGCTNNCSSGLQ